MTDHQFQVLGALLIEIRDAVLALSQEVIVETSDECTHPDEQRVSLATPGDPHHWICHACRYENRSSIAN
jgi:hypothetical protein